jgi:CheY-like chemotaxis protein
MASKRRTLLCIDDHETSLAGWCLYLQNAGYDVQTARTPQEGLELLAVRPIDLVLLDYVMPGMNGREVAAVMKRIKPDVRIVMFSGVFLSEAAQADADAFVEKGQHPVAVVHKIEELLGERET